MKRLFEGIYLGHFPKLGYSQGIHSRLQNTYIRMIIAFGIFPAAIYGSKYLKILIILSYFSPL